MDDEGGTAADGIRLGDGGGAAYPEARLARRPPPVASAAPLLEDAFGPLLHRRDHQLHEWWGLAAVRPAAPSLPEAASAVSEMCDAFIATRRRHADVGRAIDHLECQARTIEAARNAIKCSLTTVLCPGGAEDDLVGVHSITGAKEPRVDAVMSIVDELVREETAKRDTSALQCEYDETGAYVEACRKLFKCSHEAILGARNSDWGWDSDDGDGAVRKVPACAVCKERGVSAALVPCGHAFCHACASRVVDARSACPMCRRTDVTVMPVFM